MPQVPYYSDAKMTINIQVLNLKVSNLAYVLQYPLLTIRGQTDYPKFEDSPTHWRNSSIPQRMSYHWNMSPFTHLFLEIE